ncbi:MAG: 50S ribosomal protein L15 [Planctomycetota bacterium]|nr:MAG: 50S ribosomal protein L15 [Planctomycetota bacterium]
MDLKTLNALPSIRKKKPRKRVGRGTGSGTGKTAGRGHKGQGQRSGRKILDYYEGGQMPLQRRMPKRGFKNALFRRDFVVINVADLNGRFSDGDAVTHESLRKVGLVKELRDGVKLLGDGELTVKNLEVTVARASKSAIAKVEALGGSVTQTVEVNRPRRRKKDWAAEARRLREQGGKGKKK